MGEVRSRKDGERRAERRKSGGLAPQTNVELIQGYLATHERYFLGLDTLPLFLGVSVYVWFWPGKYLTPETRVAPSDTLPTPEGEMGEDVPMQTREKGEDVFRA